MRVSRRVQALSRRLAALGPARCACGGVGGVDVSFPAEGEPEPPPQRCPGCGLERQQVIVRFRKRWLEPKESTR